MNKHGAAYMKIVPDPEEEAMDKKPTFNDTVGSSEVRSIQINYFIFR